ncbi:MAG: lipoyl(octanoyl) transferase LipB [Alistipes sp.]
MDIAYRDLSLMDYKECWAYQQSLFDTLLSRKGSLDAQAGYLLLVEHPAVYTLGKSGRETNMLIDEQTLAKIGACYYHIDRGGDITFHGKGQLVGYPILDLEKIGMGLKDYIHRLEQAIIRTVATFGITAGRIEGASGVWIEGTGVAPRKICAIGVRASRYVTMHGFALNVSTDLNYFSYINPCGFVDRGVTSLEKELGKEVSMDEVKSRVVQCLSEELNVKIYKN